MTEDPHADHGDVTLSLAEQLPDGGLLYQSWPICACTLEALRARLGPPRHQSLATREQVETTGRAILSVDSGLKMGEGL
ncbi:hypothetical protein Ssi03_62420 [Sphaerisporangium siamense]|uniref:Uncharacterized protein n=1 Tax=Sphaerisporangium siamense TaxID=795645 RepID=A0A7W7D967_9ACTN|nr:hypothetical protein [Sphaerisporangium siamense]MBB4702552.1 hypothetical protein [Sphaerisporangium siamense]GII88252.1 hypothetical protein Ssi03_62420 [Sphaerisporangium siamense]